MYLEISFSADIQGNSEEEIIDAFRKRVQEADVEDFNIEDLNDDFGIIIPGLSDDANEGD